MACNVEKATTDACFANLSKYVTGHKRPLIGYC